MSLAEGSCLSPMCGLAELGEVRGQHPPCAAGRRDMNWPTHTLLSCHVRANWHLMVIFTSYNTVRQIHLTSTAVSWVWQPSVLLSCPENTRISHIDSFRGETSFSQTFSGAARLTGTQSVPAVGANVSAHGEGDGAVTAVGRGGNGVGSTTVTATRLGEVSGAGQCSDHKLCRKQGQELQSSPNPRQVCGSPSPLEPTWGSTHPKSPNLHLALLGLY